jgi:hypothetical protein
MLEPWGLRTKAQGILERMSRWLSLHRNLVNIAQRIFWWVGPQQMGVSIVSHTWMSFSLRKILRDISKHMISWCYHQN